MGIKDNLVNNDLCLTVNVMLEKLTYIVAITNVSIYNIKTGKAKEELLWQISMKGSRS